MGRNKLVVVGLHYLPEPLDLQCILCAMLEARVRLPVGHIDAADAADDQLQFAFVERPQQVAGY